MTLLEASERIVWTDLVCEEIVIDKESKRLGFHVKRYDWTENREFLAQEGWIYFENLAGIEITADPKTEIEDLTRCHMGFTSYKLLPGGIELEALITGKRYYQFCEIDNLYIRVFAEYLIWQPETENEEPKTKDN